MKKQIMFFCLTIIFLFIQIVLFAQNKIEFLIKDGSTNETMVGVNVVIKGTSRGAFSDIQGIVNFLDIPDGNQVFEFSIVGYKKQQIEFIFPKSETETAVLITMLPNVEVMEEVIVSSTRTNSRIEDLPTKIEVLGLDDMMEENGIKPGNIASILGDIAGIQMQQTSAVSGNLMARIQGLNGRYSQILRDGMPLYGGFSGSLSILQIPPLDLKQIEIIKGSASTLFGGDAIGGIINLVSKTPSETPETNFLMNQTSLNETDINTYISRKYKKFGATFFAGYVYQKAFDVNKDGFSDVPNLSTFVIHPKLFFYLSKSTTANIGFTGSYENRKGGDMEVLLHSANAQHPYFVKHQSNRNTIDVNIEKKLENQSSLSFKVSSSFLNRSIENKDYLFSANQNLYFSELSYFLKKNRYDFVFGANLNGDFFHPIKSDSINLLYYNYLTIGFFVQNDFRITEKLLIESGLRYDFHSQYGGFVLPRLSALYKFNSKLSARINGGFGYKIPIVFGYIEEETDLNRLFSNTFNFKPEQSKGLNLDVNYNTLLWNKLSATVNQSFFYTLLDNPVVYSLDSMFKVNLFSALKPVETSGLQSYLRLSFKKFELYLSYVYTHVVKKYDTSNPWFLTTPEHNFAGTLAYDPNEKWRFGLEGSFIGNQYIESYKKTSSYLFLAAMIQRKFNKVSLVLNCENLLDFRQKDFLIPPINNPSFKAIWAPIDGRVINFSVNFKL